MKHPAQLQAEHNDNSTQIETRYTEVRDSVGKALQRAMAIRAALASFELKVETAVAEFDAELKTVESNFAVTD